MNPYDALIAMADVIRDNVGEAAQGTSFWPQEDRDAYASLLARAADIAEELSAWAAQAEPQ